MPHTCILRIAGRMSIRRLNCYTVITSALQAHPTIRYNYDFVSELRERLQSANVIAIEKMQLSKARSKLDHDKTVRIGTSFRRLSAGEDPRN